MVALNKLMQFMYIYFMLPNILKFIDIKLCENRPKKDYIFVIFFSNKWSISK